MNNQDGSKVTVTVDNFVVAETHMTMVRYALQGGLGKVIHIRQPVPLDREDVIRMNRDTIYSIGIFDLTSPLIITKPDAGDRYQSMTFVSENHSVFPSEYGSGEFTISKEMMGSRYALVIFRTFVDASNPSDIVLANKLQDQIKWYQKDIGKLDVPNWDEASLLKLRQAINLLASTKTETSGMFGLKSELNPIEHLLGTAYGWGGLPKEAAIYINGVPMHNNGKTPYTLTLKNVPVDGFWAVTLYSEEGFMEANEKGVNSYNSVTSQKNHDGSVTIHFGGDLKTMNYLPIMKCWNYVLRLYRPRPEVMDGTWIVPEAIEVKSL